MIIKTNILKDICSTILPAVDNSLVDPLQITSTLELVSDKDVLYINVTNREYFVQAALPTIIEEPFHATVNAVLFLKLISQITTEDIQFEIKNNSLQVKGNGIYKLPLIFSGSELLKLPRIDIQNITCQMNIKNEYLQNILKFNSKELKKGTIVSPVQKMYYLDEKGCITFTSGACVNEFELEKPIRILLNEKLVKLFKLFKTEDIEFTYGIDPTLGDSLQEKVKFSNKAITISAILQNDPTLIKSVPVRKSRELASNIYPHQVEISKGELLSALNRLTLFKSLASTGSYIFEFQQNKLIIKDESSGNQEEVKFLNEQINIENYTARIDFTDLKLTLETYDESYFTFCYGNHTNIMTIRGNIKNIIPEVVMMRNA